VFFQGPKSKCGDYTQGQAFDFFKFALHAHRLLRLSRLTIQHSFNEDHQLVVLSLPNLFRALLSRDHQKIKLLIFRGSFIRIVMFLTSNFWDRAVYFYFLVGSKF
jgi:hypothetical protein